MQSISPFLWFDNDAEAAAEFYVSIFPNSNIISKTYYQSETPSNKPIGSVMTVNFTIDGMEFGAINGGPEFKFNEAISLVIKCKDQKEIDHYWQKLSANPANEVCGWCKDKFGLFWQVVPENLQEMIKNEKSMKAMLTMKKIIIKDLEA